MYPYVPTRRLWSDESSFSNLVVPKSDMSRWIINGLQLSQLPPFSNPILLLLFHSSKHPSSSSSSTLFLDPEIIHTISHSLIRPSPRLAPLTSLHFQTSDGEEEEGVGVQAEKAQERMKMCPGDFEILRVVGEGAFGKVFQVRKKENIDGEDDGIFAMKVMRKDTIIKKNHVDYMKAERDILTKFVHPFIVQLQYSFQVDVLEAAELEQYVAAEGLHTLVFYTPPQALMSIQ